MNNPLMKSIAHAIADHSLLDGADRSDDLPVAEGVLAGAATIYRRSITSVGDGAILAAVAIAPDHTQPFVVGQGSRRSRRVLLAGNSLPSQLPGEHAEIEGLNMQLVPPSPEVMAAVMELLPWTKPVSVRRRKTTFGLGDRVGLATAGQLAAAEQFEVAPVLAQQSIRELEFIGRTFPDVVADAAFGVLQCGYRRGYGADGDHLKTIADIDTALDADMPMITLDLTDVLAPEAAEWSDAEVEQRFASVASELHELVEKQYAGKRYELAGADGEPVAVTISVQEARRCALMYGKALAFSEEVDAHLKKRTGDSYDLEISVDETTFATLPSHHLFIARELERRGVQVSSLAPRFVGEFQKAVDYDGDLAEFERQFAVHAAIATTYGGYKISVHSGSDKFSVYPIVGRLTAGRLHVKTSGTSWLESLRTLAKTEPALYRELHRRAEQYFPEARKAYHITPDLSTVAKLDSVSDEQLSTFLDSPAARQMLHVIYGGVLSHEPLAGRYYDALAEQERAHIQHVGSHIERHLDLLGVERR